MNIGRVSQVIGPVIDVEFDTGKIPEIYTAITIDEKIDGREIKLTAEVEQQIGRNQVRAIAMSTTDGVQRGMKVVDTGAPISVPVGKVTLGRIFNVLGEPIDNLEPLPAGTARRAIHAEPPGFDALEPKTQMFETGI